MTTNTNGFLVLLTADELIASIPADQRTTIHNTTAVAETWLRATWQRVYNDASAFNEQLRTLRTNLADTEARLAIAQTQIVSSNEQLVRALAQNQQGTPATNPTTTTGGLSFAA